MTDELARVKRIGKETADLNRNDPTLVLANAFNEVAMERDALRVQNAELLAALRECANSLESEASAREFDGHSTIHASRMARKARAVIAKAEGGS